MNKSAIETVRNDITARDLAALLQKDGAVIVENLLDGDQLSALNDDLDTHLKEIAPGLRNPTSDWFVDFFGKKTVRMDGLPGKSKTFVDVMQLPLMTGVADELLLPNCQDYLLNTGQIIQIGPGETAQALHRDEDAWRYYKNPHPLLQVEAMFALTEFTSANGATQVVPGSHRWPAEREARPEEVARAEMSAGSALIYLGSALHGGGANTTSDEWRRGMFMGFVVGWLRTEENTFLTVPIEAVREMPVRCQELLGYKSHEGIGVYDVGSPMVLVS